jgi:regulator of sigma E protease
MRDGMTITETLSAETGIVPNEPDRRAVGLSMGLIEIVRKPLHIAFYDGAIHTVKSTYAIIAGTASLLRGAFTFTADLSQVAGPIGLVGLVEDAASFGFTSLLLFSAFISLNLAVINILPFPALDGGRLLFVVIEAIKGSPIPARIAYRANAIGFLLLILLMVAVTYNDILRLIG